MKRVLNKMGFGLACVLLLAVAASGANANAAASTHKKTRKHHHSEPKQKAPTADRITEIQSALAREGYYQGDPTGKMDSNTVAALQKFQSVNGIDGNGKLDAPTLQKLGLGSDIAGVSAPKPVMPASAAPVQSPATPQTANPSPAITGSISASNSQATQSASTDVH